MEIGSIFLTKRSIGIVTFPIGSIPSIQEFTDHSHVVPLNCRDKSDFEWFLIKNRVISNAFKLDAVRYLYTQHSRDDLCRKSNRKWWQLWIKRDLPNSAEPMYWYLCRLSVSIEEKLKKIDPKSVTKEDIYRIVIENKEIFETIGSNNH